MSGFPGQGHYGAANHPGGAGGFGRGYGQHVAQPPAGYYGGGPGGNYNQGYNHGYNQGYNQGPPPGGYGGPPQPPPGYGGGGPPPPGPGYGPPQGGGYNQYPPPNRPPPQNVDAYGYPIQPIHSPAPGYGGPGGRAGPPPPTAPQNFGQGAPQGYTFQYSNCTGKRKALLIGINYFGQKGELRGCINDTKNMSTFLNQRYNYQWEDMVILTDDQSDPRKHPTKDNIIRAMGWLVSNARPNDSLFLHYSGNYLLFVQ